MKSVVTFGEVMLRLCPPDGTRIGQTEALKMTFGGAEANVAVSLANFGMPARYLTKLPDNPLTSAFFYQMRGFGVDISKIAVGGERMGVYFVEKGASMRPSKVVYDRKYSAISAIAPGDIDWNAAFADAGWFHWTGITPALSDAAAAETLAACKAAKEMGLTVSCDLNYRKNLWSREKAGSVMRPLMEYVDVLIANEEDPKDVFGIAAENSDIEGGKLNAEGYAALAKKLSDAFGLKKCAFTLRESISANDNNWSGILYDAESRATSVSQKYAVHIVDRVGGGDSFGAGLIYSLSQGKSDGEAVRFAVAASALKHTIEGDFNRVSVAEVESLLKSGGSGRVQR